MRSRSLEQSRPLVVEDDKAREAGRPSRIMPLLLRNLRRILRRVEAPFKWFVSPSFAGLANHKFLNLAGLLKLLCLVDDSLDLVLVRPLIQRNE